MKLFAFFICLVLLTLPAVAQKSGSAGTYTNSLYSSLSAYWSLDETSGDRFPYWYGSTDALDLADNNTVGSAAGKIGNAASFVAANSEFLSANDNPAISMGNIDFTLAVWVYLGDQSTDRRVYHKGNGLGAGQFAYALRYAQSSGKMRFAISDGSSATGVNSTESISAATWYFVVCQHDAMNNLIGISIDGGAFATASWTTGSWDDSHSLLMGSDTASTYYDGRIDSLMIWKRLLTAAEIAYLYNSGTGRAPL